MNIVAILCRLEKLMQEYPPGAVVWHRACGKRGVIVEYTVAADGSIMIVVSFGANTNWEKCLPHELSATKVSDGTDGDEWKENAGA